MISSAQGWVRDLKNPVISSVKPEELIVHNKKREGKKY
jgi:hypothetical protein